MTNPPNISGLQAFFLECAGVDSTVFESDRGFSGEIKRLATLGLVLVITTVFAFFTGWFALDYIFDFIPIQIFGALLWAAFIFSLDRQLYISTSMLVGIAQIPAVLVRLVVAVAVGIIISTPFELRLHESEIIPNLNAIEVDRINKATKDAQFELDVRNDVAKESVKQNTAVISKLEEENVRIQSKIDQASGKIQDARNSPPNVRVSKIQDATRAYRLIAYPGVNTIKANVVEIKKLQIKTARIRKEQVFVPMPEDFPSLKRKSKFGLSDRINALNRFYRESANPVMEYALKFLFVLIELAPILSKLLTRNPVYDRLVAARDSTLIEQHVKRIERQQNFRDFIDEATKFTFEETVESGEYPNRTNLTSEDLGLDELKRRVIIQVFDEYLADLGRATSTRTTTTTSPEPASPPTPPIVERETHVLIVLDGSSGLSTSPSIVDAAHLVQQVIELIENITPLHLSIFLSTQHQPLVPIVQDFDPVTGDILDINQQILDSAAVSADFSLDQALASCFDEFHNITTANGRQLSQALNLVVLFVVGNLTCTSQFDLPHVIDSLQQRVPHIDLEIKVGFIGASNIVNMDTYAPLCHPEKHAFPSSDLQPLEGFIINDLRGGEQWN